LRKADLVNVETEGLDLERVIGTDDMLRSGRVGLLQVEPALSANVRGDAQDQGISDLEGENGECRTWRRARMELDQRLRLLPPAAKTSDP
jgi:hypothetical protein